MARIFIVDGAGARAGDLAASRERFDEANKEAFGADLDEHAHTPQNQIAGINALVATELGEELVRAALYGASVNHAQGAFLDALGGLLDIHREQETFSRVTATLNGIPGTNVPAGRFAKNTSGDTFVSETDVIIRDGGSTVSFVAQESGPKDVSPNTLTEIVSVVSGWETITNAEEGIIGRETETDARYRANIKARTAQSSIGSISAMQSALNAAGASRVRILENSTASQMTVSGVDLPPHSILVIADGGLLDDISRAVENHRGMGVNTFTALQGGEIDLDEARKITNGRMVFNGQGIAGFNLSGENINGMVDQLNAATSLVEFSNSGNHILTLHSWNPDTTGYEDVGGNISYTGGILPEFKPITAHFRGTKILLSFPSPVVSMPYTSIFIRYLNSSGNQQSKTIADQSAVKILGNIVEIEYGNTPVDSNETNVTIECTNISSEYLSSIAFPPVEVTRIPASAFAAPRKPIVYGEPRNNGAVVWAGSLGNITSWQYRRFQAGAYLDNAWVDIPNTNAPSRPLLTGTNIANGYSLTGFTNGNTCRIDLRALNSGNPSSEVTSYVFIPNNTAPSPTSYNIDGRLVTIEYNLPLKPGRTALSAATNQWTIGGFTNSVQEQITNKNKIQLRLNNPAPTTLTNGTVTFTHNPSVAPVGLNDVRIPNISAQALTNNTLPGVPGAPVNPIAYKTSTGWSVSFNSNYDGGLNIDFIQYSTLPEDSNIWSEWTSVVSGNLPEVNTTVFPADIRLRSSNPNARAADILMLVGNTITYPFARSIPQRLVVGVEIHRDATITTDDFEAIKTSLVNLINSYEIGATLWQADLQARVESLASIRLASPLTVTSAGAAVNGETQNALNRWTLSSDDITITFVN